MRSAILIIFMGGVFLLAAQNGVEAQRSTYGLPPRVTCPRIVIKCKRGCFEGTNEKGCKVCICLPPKSSCPQLTKCRPECSGYVLVNGCPRCARCPPQDDGCRRYKCTAGSILGNPDEDNCDRCVSPLPATCADLPACRHGCRRTYDLGTGCPDGCEDCPSCLTVACTCLGGRVSQESVFECARCVCPSDYYS